MPKNQEIKKVGRGMPNNVEAEASVLGSILIDNVAADSLIPRLKEDDFYLAQNRAIFNAMKELQRQSKAVDTVTVADALEVAGKLDEVGSVAYLSELAEGVISAANSEHYLSIVKRDSMLRRVISAGNDMVKFAYDADDGEKALDNAERLVYDLAERDGEKGLLPADDAFAGALNAIQDAQVGKVNQRVIRTGFPKLDKTIKGLKPGELVIVAARPSVGKTALALNIAVNAALKEDKKVAIFSLEMGAELLAKRMLAYESQVTFEDMDRQGGLSGKKADILMKAFKRLVSCKNLFIDDYTQNTPNDILSKCRRLKREKGLELVIVDYLSLLTGDAGMRYDNRQAEVSDMSRKMKKYAKELDCPIILLAQLNRGSELRKEEPQLSDLRESGQIEQDADVVAFLHRPSSINPALPPNLIQLFIRKNRNGPTCEIQLDWTGNTTTFREIQEGEEIALDAVATPSNAKGPGPISVEYKTNDEQNKQSDLTGSDNEKQMDEEAEAAADSEQEGMKDFRQMSDFADLKEITSDVMPFDAPFGDEDSDENGAAGNSDGDNGFENDSDDDEYEDPFDSDDGDDGDLPF